MADGLEVTPLDGAVAGFLSRVLDELLAGIGDEAAVRETLASLGVEGPAADPAVSFLASRSGEVSALRAGVPGLLAELLRPHPDLASLVPQVAPLWAQVSTLGDLAPTVALPGLPDPGSLVEVLLGRAVEETVRASAPMGWTFAKALHLVGPEVPVLQVVSDVLDSPTGYVWRRFQHLRRHLDVTVVGLLTGPRSTSVVTVPIAEGDTVSERLRAAVPAADLLLGRVTVRLAADAYEDPHTFTFEVAGHDPGGGGPPEFAAVALTTEGIAAPLRLGESLTIRPDPFGAPFGVAATGFGDVVALTDGTSPSISLGSSFEHGLTLGDAGGIHLVLGTPVLEPHMGPAGWGLRAGVDTFELAIPADVAGPVLALLLPADGVRLTGRLVVVADAAGLHLEGGIGMRTTWPDTLRLPGLFVRDLTTEVLTTGGAVELTATGTVTVALGPISVTVQGLGVRQPLELRARGDGNLGLLELSAPVLAMPTGVGVSLDAAILKGGGFLAFHGDEVVGALELALTLGSVEIAVRAVGVIGRVDGAVSFVVVISVEFSPAIEIFLGLTLNAVGGVFGLNRTLDENGLTALVRAGRMEDVMFPRDLAARALEVVASVKQVFPERRGQFVVGPMLKLGWGRPVSFVTVSVGVVFTFPDPVVIAIVGSMRITLPAPDAPVVDIRADFAGTINATTGDVQFDASLTGSRIATFDVSGDIALRAGPSGFLFSAGGFHPKFRPPPGLGEVRRLAISIAPAAILSIRAEAYFAVTASTVQFGGGLFVAARLGPIGIRGHLGLDVLVHTEPVFSFVAEISGQFRLSFSGQDVLSASIEVLLEGPQRWHARARAEIEFLFFSVSGSLELEWGDTSAPTLGPAVDVAAEVRAALAAPHVWCHVIPASDGAVVTHREGATALHPLGRLRLTQTVAPLGVPLERFGTAAAKDPTGVTVAVSAAFARTDPTSELFPPAQFFALSDDERLGKPSFVPYLAGYTVQGSDWAPLADPVTVDVVYEESNGEERPGPGLRRFGSVAGEHLGWAVLGAAGRAHGQTVAPSAPRAGLHLKDVPYAAVDAATGAAMGGAPAFAVENVLAASMRYGADTVVLADYELAALS